ncbi:hypothetical protein OROHE_001504 [Orobanche hederae]
MEMFLVCCNKINPVTRGTSDKTKHWGDLVEEEEEEEEEEEQEEEIEEKELEDGIQPFKVDLLRSQKSDKVDITLAPEELDAMENVLPAKYEEAREEEKLRTQREDFSDMVVEDAKRRKRKMHEKENKSKKYKF